MEKRERVAECEAGWMDGYAEEERRGRQPRSYLYRAAVRPRSFVRSSVRPVSVYLPDCFAASLLPYHRINSPCLPHLTSPHLGSQSPPPPDNFSLFPSPFALPQLKPSSRMGVECSTQSGKKTFSYAAAGRVHATWEKPFCGTLYILIYNTSDL